MKKGLETIVIAIIASLISSVLVVILEEPFIVEFDLNEITTINGGSSYISTESGKLINNYRSGVIFPNDKITYKTDLNNKKEIPIMIKPTIKVVQAGQNVIEPTELESVNISNNEKISFSEEFFIAGEGHVEIIIEYQIFNTTDNKQIDFARISKDVEVLSLSDKLQSDQNNTLLAGIIASSIIGGGTLTALYFNQKTSKIEISRLDKHNKLAEEQIQLLEKQNQQLKDQFEVQNRPWIGVSRWQINEDGRIGFYYRNFGKTPPTSVEIEVFEATKNISKEEVQKNHNSEKSNKVGSLFPEQERLYLFPQIRMEKFFEAEKKNIPYFLIVSIKYTYEKKHIGEFGQIAKWSFVGHEFEAKEQWLH